MTDQQNSVTDHATTDETATDTATTTDTDTDTDTDVNAPVPATEPHSETTAAGDTETAQVLESVAATEGDAHASGAEALGEGLDDSHDEGEDEGGDEGDGPAGEGEARPAGVSAARRPKVAELEREGEVAADFLETLLDIADLDGDLDVDVDGDRAAISIVDSEEGRVPRRLVGPDGKVLDALQELTRLAVQSVTGERSRLMLDVAGHRAERRSALVKIAQEAIEEVRRTGDRKVLEPMSAFERKVVHDEVLAAGLSSESEGVEPRRCVVVQPTA